LVIVICLIFVLWNLGFKNFGAWNFGNSRTNVGLNIGHNWCNIFL
jgi:hypothetical protein